MESLKAYMIHRIIFQKGLEVSPSPHSVPTTGRTLGETVTDIRQRFGVKPVVYTQHYDSEAAHGGEMFVDEHCTTLSADSHDPLEVRSNVITELWRTAGSHDKCYEWGYWLQGTIYHCRQIALLYSAMCRDIWRINQRMPDHGPRSTYQGQTEPFYEFDALTAKARRCYDYIAYMLWTNFERHPANCPNNCADILKRGKAIPNAVKSRLKVSWDEYGSKLKEYRDCIMHFSSLDAHNATGFMERLADGVWSTKILIPDNPGSRKKRGFTYERQLDALDFAWMVANDLTELTESAVREIAAKRTSGT